MSSTSALAPPPAVTKKKGPRRDIQGLRAVAVLAVVFDHLFHWPNGGFVGVDVFFVLSGFLITGLLLNEQARSGRISWVGFYRRRIRRIIPASTIVLVVTVIAAAITFNPVRARETRIDAIWAFFFAGNWRFESLATDYFTQDGPVSPLQHYWSLGIEEQFYFVWPWLMLLIFTVFLRRGYSMAATRTAVGIAIGSATVASFAFAMWQSEVNPAGAYFSSFTRVWELGLGATLAVAVPLLTKIPDRIRPALAWIGLVAMIGAIAFTPNSDGFPAPWAAWAVLATCLVVAAGTGIDQQKHFWLITNRPMNYVGDISYSLYLWHFPVIIIGQEYWGESAAAKIGLLVVMAALSVYSYHLIEDPIRHSSWLDGKPRRSRRHRPTRVPSKGLQRGWASFLCLGAVALCAIALQKPEPPRAVDLPAVSAATNAGADDTATTGPKQQALSSEIVQALKATSWPELSPSIEEAVDSELAPDDLMSCATADGAPQSVTDCVWGDAGAKRSAVLVGDSIAATYSSPLRDVITDAGWKFYSRNARGCPFVDMPVAHDDPNVVAACPGAKAQAVEDINKIKPDILFLTNYSFSGPDYSPTWTEATIKQLNKVAPSVRRIVILGSPPMTPNPVECYTPRSAPVDCSAQPPSAWTEMRAMQETVATEVGGIYIDTEPWFCASGYCPAFVGKTPVRIDAAHMNQWYGQKITPVIAETLQKARVLGKPRA